MVSRLIGMGSYHHVIDKLSNSISEVLTTHSSCDFLLPGDNYPYWLAYTGEGYSVPFQVPDDSECWMKGMTLCGVYSSAPKSMAIESLASVFIFNYTKCTIHMYKQAPIMSFTDEDWQGIISNLGPGDNVEIFVAFGHEMTVKKTGVYLIYGQSITTMEPSTEVEIEPSVIVRTGSTNKPKKNIFSRSAKKMRGCLCLN
ncbi:hypothetical protein VNO78_24248 [Psophocarpus tetragonolobus]|uniref:TMV resistance protein N n=1 Tax=Psophocarpus tetragonolobus TaxID=3891 RepID=A0AAN9XE96_PSOTE